MLRWSIVYYSFVFLLTIYFILQQLITLVLVTQSSKNKFGSLTFHALKIQFDSEEPKWIWDFWEFYVGITLSAVICITLVILITRLISKSPLKYLGFVTVKKKDLVWILYFIPIYLILEVIIRYFNLEFDLNLSGAEKYKFLLILGVGIVGPFFEEVLFRGFLLTRINEITNSKYHWLTLLVVSLLFTLPHFQYNFYQLLIIFCLGLYFSFVKWKTGNLWIPIIIHSLNNVVTTYLLFMD